MVPTKQEAAALLKKYNSDPFHLKHAEIVSGVMESFARELGYGDEAEFWGIVGLLHDLDFEQFPDQHCIKEQELMRQAGLDESIIHATASHGYGITMDIRPEHEMEKGALRDRRADGADRRGGADASVEECAGFGVEIREEEVQVCQFRRRLLPRGHHAGRGNAGLDAGRSHHAHHRRHARHPGSRLI